MKAPYILLFFMLSLPAASCAPALSRVEREEVLKVELLDTDELEGRAFESLGTLRGVVCQGPGHSADQEAARMELRIKAFQRKANAVINVLCRQQTGGTLQCQVCTGEAIRYENAF